MTTKNNAGMGHVIKTIQSLTLSDLKGFSDTTTVNPGQPSERVITLRFAVFEPEARDKTPEESHAGSVTKARYEAGVAYRAAKADAARKLTSTDPDPVAED